MVCKSNKYITEIYAIIFQVFLLGVFLSLFFFLYVVNVEKEEFETQMNLIVDEILTKDEIKNFIPDTLSDDQKEELAFGLSGIISVIEKETSLENKKTNEKIEKQNSKTQRKTIKIVILVFWIIIILCSVLFIFKYCVPITSQIEESLWIILFVALTEIFFLQFIGKNYISVNPNKVKEDLGNTILNWLKKNPE